MGGFSQMTAGRHYSPYYWMIGLPQEVWQVDETATGYFYLGLPEFQPNQLQQADLGLRRIPGFGILRRSRRGLGQLLWLRIPDVRCRYTPRILIDRMHDLACRQGRERVLGRHETRVLIEPIFTPRMFYT